jgi:pectate lyase C
MTMFRKILGGAILVAAASVAQAATDYPSGYTKCAKEGQTCSFSGTRSVAYGKSGSFVYATLTGPITCSGSLFPSTSVGNPRYCSYSNSGSSSSSSSSTSSSTSSSSSSSSTSSSTSSSSSSSSSSGGITGATCSSQGSTSISATVKITSGTYDGGCRTFNPSGALGDGSQDEGQDPAFRVENGATLRNAILGNNGVDGVHFYNGGTLTNFRWTNIGEDAFTIKSSGTANISGVSGYSGEDKFGQINASGTVNISNCIVDSVAKVIRQNGGTTFKTTVNIDRCQLSNLKEGVFRSDSSSSVARLTNSRLRNSGSLCIGSWASCTGSGNTNY